MNRYRIVSLVASIAFLISSMNAIPNALANSEPGGEAETGEMSKSPAADSTTTPNNTSEIPDLAQPIEQSTGPGADTKSTTKNAAEVTDMAKPVGTGTEVEVNSDLAGPVGSDSSSKYSQTNQSVEIPDLAKPVESSSVEPSTTEASDKNVGKTSQKAADKTPNPRLLHPNQEAKLALEYPNNTPFPLVGIRFPIDYGESFPRDLQQLKAFQKESEKTLEQFAGEQIVKSSYLAAAFYEHLSEKMPDKSVVLIPTRMQFDKTTNKVIAVPPSKPIPSLVLVDLCAGLSIERVKEPASHLRDSDTFGTRARTMVSLSMPLAGKRQVFAGQPLVQPGNEFAGEEIETFYNVVCNKKKQTPATTIGDLKVTNKSVYSDGTFVAMPTDFRYEYSQISTEPTTKQLALYSNLVIDALNSQSLAESQKTLLAEYIADIDPEVSEYLASNGAGNSPAQLKNKLNWFKHCLLHQRRELMARETFDLCKTLRSNEFAKQHRDSMKAEADYAKQLSGSKARSAFGSVLTFASTAGAIAGAFAPTGGIPVTSICSTLATTAASVVAAEAKLQAKLRQDFRETMSQARTTEVKCVVMLDNEKVEVDGNSMEEFRKNSIQGYAKKFGTTVSKQAGVL
jgi:hypothetical protein